MNLDKIVEATYKGKTYKLRGPAGYVMIGAGFEYFLIEQFSIGAAVVITCLRVCYPILERRGEGTCQFRQP
jgi:hypothetical protein